MTAQYFDHSRGLLLLAIDSNQRCRDALLGMTDDTNEVRLPSLLVHRRAITWFTVNVKCIAYRYTVSGHRGNNALHSTVRWRYSVAE